MILLSSGALVSEMQSDESGSSEIIYFLKIPQTDTEFKKQKRRYIYAWQSMAPRV